MLPPVAQSRKGSLRLIRPLVYVTEDLSTEYARSQGFLAIGCVCSEKESVRKEIRAFLTDMKLRHPGIPESVTAALGATIDSLKPAAPGLRWSPVKNLHITTKFVGSWPDTRLYEMKSALTAISSPAFEVDGWARVPRWRNLKRISRLTKGCLTRWL